MTDETPRKPVWNKGKTIRQAYLDKQEKLAAEKALAETLPAHDPLVPLDAPPKSSRLTAQRMQYLDEHYEDVLLAYLAGMSIERMLRQVVPNGDAMVRMESGFVRRTAQLWLPVYYRWLDKLPATQRDEVAEARVRGAEQVIASVEDTLENADDSTRGGAAKAKHLAEFRRWFAGTLDSRYKDAAPVTAVQINLGDAFTRALESSSQRAKLPQVVEPHRLTSGDVV